MFWKCKGRLILFNGRGYRKENKIPVVFPYRKLKVSSLGNFSFKRLKLKFLHDETKVSHRWNYSFSTAKPKVPMHETIGFAVLIYSHISILVHNREDTIQNHTSLLIKVLLKCFKLIFSSDATLPPCTPETCTIAYKLNKCGSNGIYSDT